MLSRTTTLLWTCRESNPDLFNANGSIAHTIGPRVERVPVYYGPFIEEICRAVWVKGMRLQDEVTRVSVAAYTTSGGVAEGDVAWFWRPTLVPRWFAFCRWRDDGIMQVICPTCQMSSPGSRSPATARLLCMGLFSIFWVREPRWPCGRHVCRDPGGRRTLACRRPA